jgi:hypothetical protein
VWHVLTRTRSCTIMASSDYDRKEAVESNAGNGTSLFN